MALVWLPWISMFVTTLVAAGACMGIYCACQRIYGTSAGVWFVRSPQSLTFRIDSRKKFHAVDYHLGRIPAGVLAAGVWGISGGILWLPQNSGDVIESGPLWLVTALWAGFGVLYAVAVRFFFVRNPHYARFRQLLAAGMLSSLAFGLGGWSLYGLNVVVFMFPIGWLIGIITTMLVAGDAFADLDRAVGRGILAGILTGTLLGLLVWIGVRFTTILPAGGDVGLLFGVVGTGMLVTAIAIALAGFFVHVPLSLVARLWVLLTFLIVTSVEKLCDRLLTPILIRLRFRTIVCNQCLRYTHAFRARYENGVRYCEHCRQDVEYTRARGKVIVVFGKLPIEQEGRIFLLTNPNFELNTQALDIAEVYFDTASADPRLVERFLTYIINYPPEGGVKSVQIFYQGHLEGLGRNFKNALYNNFSAIQPLNAA